MAEPSGSDPVRGRGRGRSRGGLGKYLRACGRGGRGRPAEFNKRLLLQVELRKPELTEEEADISGKDNIAAGRKGGLWQGALAEG